MTKTVARPALPAEKAAVGIILMTPDPSKTDKLAQVTILLSPPAFDYMLEGRAHTCDLTKLGINAQIIIGRCDDIGHGFKMLEEANAARGLATIRDANIDVTISKEGK